MRVFETRNDQFVLPEVEKEGFNPKTQEKTLVKRRALTTDFGLPMRDAHDNFIAQLLVNQ